MTHAELTAGQMLLDTKMSLNCNHKNIVLVDFVKVLICICSCVCLYMHVCVGVGWRWGRMV